MTLMGFSSVLGGDLKTMGLPLDGGGRLMFVGRLLHFHKLAESAKTKETVCNHEARSKATMLPLLLSFCF